MTAETSNARGDVVAWFPTNGRGEIIRTYGDGSPVYACRTKEEAEQAKRCHLGATGPVIPLYAAPPPAAARGDVRYDRELIARMLDVCGHPMFTLDAYREQARLLREADNAGAEKVGTARALTAAQQQGLRIVEPIRNCATPESREAAMVVLETDAEGNPTIWCDPEIADLVRALNVGGVRTKASCSGHGEKPFGIVTLEDGRELLVMPDWETTRRAERLLDAGLSAQQQGQAVDLAPQSAPVGVRNAILEALNLVHAEGRARVESATAEMADRLAAIAQQPAPVGVELSALRVQEWLQREYDILPPVQEIEQAMRTPCSCPDTERALAQQPAAVDGMAELVGLLDEVRSHFTRDDDLPDDLLPRIDAALATQRQEPKS